MLPFVFIPKLYLLAWPMQGFGMRGILSQTAVQARNANHQGRSCWTVQPSQIYRLHVHVRWTSTRGCFGGLWVAGFGWQSKCKARVIVFGAFSSGAQPSALNSCHMYQASAVRIAHKFMWQVPQASQLLKPSQHPALLPASRWKAGVLW